jgi:hypothetical protein
MLRFSAGTQPVRRFRMMAMVVAAVALGVCGCTGTDEWRYFDGFSTDKAESDSYSHSGFAEVPPDIVGAGFLMYVTDLSEDRSLGFHGGLWVNDVEAVLKYEFPLRGSVLRVCGGTLEFDVGSLSGGFGSFGVAVSYVGAAGGLSERIAKCGHYEYSLQPEGAADAVRIDFVGADVTLDNLQVSLQRIRLHGGI